MSTKIFDSHTAAAPEAAETALPIGKEQVRQAMETLRRYKQGKANLEQRLIDNEQYWKLRHWQQYRAGNGGDPQPVSGWLVNVILNRHADAMDAYPQPTCLPRAADDEPEAATLNQVLPVILRNCRFRQTYSRVMYDKLKSGCGAYGVFWDSRKLHGLGDIAIRRVSLLNLFWEPGIEDIQDSRNVFCVELCHKEDLVSRYPQLQDKAVGGSGEVSHYLYDDQVDVTDKALVVDWYYRKGDRLHYCKFCGDDVLFATENEARYGSSGWYNHGRYPFVLDTLYPEEGTPCGFGYVDICKDPQKYVDVLNQAILKNTIAAATPRFFIRADGSINEEEFADWTKPFVHTDGALGQDAILPVPTAPLPATALHVLQQKVQEMRLTSGNTDSATGVATGAVTAASAIAALQEASGKLSRDMNSTTYDAFEEVVLLCIELMRQFYDAPRTFRVVGESGESGFIRYQNSGLVGAEDSAFGVALGARAAEFDIDVAPQNESRYTTAAYNELAMALYSGGFFDPGRARQALACLEMMDFKGKEAVARRIREGAMEAADAAMAAGVLRPGVNWPTGGEDDAVFRARSSVHQATRPR